MRVGSLGEAFKLVMARTGWSGSRLAREVDTSQPWVSMVLNGRRDPGLRRSAELLARAGWELQLIPSRKEDDPVERREFLLGAASLVVLPSPTASPYSSPEHVDRLTARLAYNESQMGGAPLAREALWHVNHVTRIVESGNTRLRTSASRLCRQAALVLHDVRHLSGAERVAATALMLARTAGDQGAQVTALDTLSLISAHLPDGRGAEYARRGLAVPGADDAGRAVLAARLGRSLALMPGCASEARRGLERALELAGSDGPMTAEVAGNVGIGFSDLGMPTRAEGLLAIAMDLTTSSPFLHSLYVARRAKAAARARDAEVASDRMLTLAAVAPLVDSPRLRIHQRHILDSTHRWASIPRVRDAREALREATR